MGELLDAGHVYVPRWRPKDAPEWHAEPGTCCHAVHEGGRGVGFYQCTRKAKHKRDVLRYGKPATLEYCTIHDPVAVKRKRDDWRAKFNAKMAAERADREAREAERVLKNAALEAIRKIAAGHNDPRGLALEILSDQEPST